MDIPKNVITTICAKYGVTIFRIFASYDSKPNLVLELTSTDTAVNPVQLADLEDALEQLLNVEVNLVEEANLVFFAPKRQAAFESDLFLGSLLVNVAAISQAELDTSIRLARTEQMHLGQMLVMAGQTCQPVLHAARQAQAMLLNGFLTAQDAVIAFDYVLRRLEETPLTLTDALSELGWITCLDELRTTA